VRQSSRPNQGQQQRRKKKWLHPPCLQTISPSVAAVTCVLSSRSCVPKLTINPSATALPHDLNSWLCVSCSCTQDWATSMGALCKKLPPHRRIPAAPRALLEVRSQPDVSLGQMLSWGQEVQPRRAQHERLRSGRRAATRRPRSAARSARAAASACMPLCRPRGPGGAGQAGVRPARVHAAHTPHRLTPGGRPALARAGTRAEWPLIALPAVCSCCYDSRVCCACSAHCSAQSKKALALLPSPGSHNGRGRRAPRSRQRAKRAAHQVVDQGADVGALAAAHAEHDVGGPPARPPGARDSSRREIVTSRSFTSTTCALQTLARQRAEPVHARSAPAGRARTRRWQRSAFGRRGSAVDSWTRPEVWHYD